MKIGLWLQIIFIFCEVILFITPDVECFTIPISVSTGMAIIMALVKVKAVIVKVLLGLKAMGYESFVWRTNRRRRRSSFGTMPVLTKSSTSTIILPQDELLEAWNDLQQTVGKVIEFDLDSCLTASMSNRSRRKGLFSWDNVTDRSELKMKRDKEYSTWVSKTLGSSIKDPIACQILAEKLQPPTLEKDSAE